VGETLGIKVLDHIIFSHKGYYSFKEIWYGLTITQEVIYGH
jgi:DNA repair protein RadC